MLQVPLQKESDIPLLDFALMARQYGISALLSGRRTLLALLRLAGTIVSCWIDGAVTAAAAKTQSRIATWHELDRV